MKCVTVLVATFALLGCEQSPREVSANVYDWPVPNRSDAKAVETIRQALKYEDKNVWRNIMRLPANAKKPSMTSTTVGEAISRYRAFGACASAHDTTAIRAKLGEPPQDKRVPDYEEQKAAYGAAVNNELKAYDACFELPT
jgi:hypothetical protein